MRRDRVLAALTNEPQHVEDIAAALGQATPSHVAASLRELEAEGVAERAALPRGRVGKSADKNRGRRVGWRARQPGQ